MLEHNRVLALEHELATMRGQVDGLRTELRSRREHRPRSAVLLSAAALFLLPVLGWSAVSLTEFAAPNPIIADEVNANFSGINAALEGELVLSSQPVDTMVEACDPCVIENAGLDVTTNGGHIWIGFVPDPPVLPETPKL